MSKRILVVEDQPDNRQIIRDMLATSRRPRRGVTRVDSGSDFSRRTNLHNHQLIISSSQFGRNHKF